MTSQQLCDVFMCMTRMIRPPCEKTDQMTHKTAFRLCFNFYTSYTDIKTGAQNAPLPEKNKIYTLSPDPTPSVPRSVFPYLSTYD